MTRSTRSARAHKNAATRDDILRDHSPEVRALAERLRALILDAVPVAEERIYLGWHGIGYLHPLSGYFCGIFPGRDVVKLGFEHGDELPDPRGLLAGRGSQVRYVELRPGARVPESAVRALLRRAIGRVSA